MPDYPTRSPGEALEAHQEAMARWCGYPDADALNRDHDRFHAAICKWLGITSHALRHAAGETLNATERMLADVEEAAVLHTQRLMRLSGAEVPQ